MNNTNHQLPLDLFASPPPACEADSKTARAGLSYFNELLALYSTSWPYLVSEWNAWIAYFEHMARFGSLAASSLKPASGESEPSQMFGIYTRRLRTR